MNRRVLLIAGVLLPVTARAQPAPITVDHVWSRAAMAGHTGAVYLRISATGAPDTLTGASSPVAPNVELHETHNDNGVMKMRPIRSLTITPGKPLTLAPGGYHIMLIGLTKALTEGDSFPLTLHFAKAGAITVTARVEKAGAGEMQMPSGGAGHAGMPGMKM
jgi:hypothetical protein